MTAREAYIILNMIEGIGPLRSRALCDTLGSPERVLDAGEQELMRTPGIGAKVAENIVTQRQQLDASREEEKAAAAGGRIITQADADYPAVLKTIHDPPLCLYVRGEMTEKDAQAIALVGTRRATHYGAAQTDRLAYQLAKVGFTIVSGLARGIDTAAHRGALKAGGRTIAVLGGALDQLYPAENAPLADEIAANGAILSEFAMGRAPDRTTFPYRNRIVSGLSKAVVVMEAGVKSGAMNTAEQAMEQGRSVMALPGRVDVEGSRGPHRLIQEGARLITDVGDVLKEFEFLFPAPKREEQVRLLDPRLALDLPPEEVAIIKALWQEPELGLDEVIRRTGLPAAKVSVLSMQMEMKRIIRMLPGRRITLRDDVRHLADAAPTDPLE